MSLTPTHRQLSKDFGCVINKVPKQLCCRQGAVQAGSLSAKVERSFAIRPHIQRRLAQRVHLPEGRQRFARLFHCFGEPGSHRARRPAGKSVDHHRIGIAGFGQQCPPGGVGSSLWTGQKSSADLRAAGPKAKTAAIPRPPASHPCAMTASSLTTSSRGASATVVAVLIKMMPADLRAAIAAAPGTSK